MLLLTVLDHLYKEERFVFMRFSMFSILSSVLCLAFGCPANTGHLIIWKAGPYQTSLYVLVVGCPECYYLAALVMTVIFGRICVPVLKP